MRQPCRMQTKSSVVYEMKSIQLMTQKNVRHQNKLPKYCLDNAKEGTYSFWGDEPTTFLGWYADKEQITKEISEIHNAIVSGTATYVLKYSAKTERKWMKVKIIKQTRDV